MSNSVSIEKHLVYVGSATQKITIFMHELVSDRDCYDKAGANPAENRKQCTHIDSSRGKHLVT